MISKVVPDHTSVLNGCVRPSDGYRTEDLRSHEFGHVWRLRLGGGEQLGMGGVEAVDMIEQTEDDADVRCVARFTVDNMRAIVCSACRVAG